MARTCEHRFDGEAMPGLAAVPSYDSLANGTKRRALGPSIAKPSQTYYARVSASDRKRVEKMNALTDNAEWKLQNEKFRSPKARRPDVHYIGQSEDGKSVILADGWKEPNKRQQKWIPVPAEFSTPRKIDTFGTQEAEVLAKSRGLLPVSAATASQGKSSASKAKGETLLCVALDEIEADETAGANPNTGANTTTGCRQFRDRLEPERLQTPVTRISPKELARHVRQSIIDDDLGADTKSQYLSQARAIARKLIDDYGLDEKCEAALRAPPNMLGADTPDREFLEIDIGKMENKIGGELFCKTLDRWAEAVEGAYYFGSRFCFQPVDVVFRKWDELSPDLTTIGGRRHKTREFFFLVVSEPVRKWLLKRRAKGGIYAKGYIFPEFVHGIRKCMKAIGALGIFSHTQEEDIETNVTGRLSDYFNTFLDEICGIKRPGISFVSFRHHNLPVVKARGHSIEVAMDMAGQKTAEACFGYGGHASEQEHRSASATIERQYANCKAGTHDPVIVTAWDCAQFVVKAMRKVMKKLLTAIGNSTLEIVRKIGDLGANQARGFEATTASLNELAAQVRELNARQQTSNGEMSALRTEVCELRAFKTNSVSTTGENIMTFASNQNLGCRDFAEGSVAGITTTESK